MQHSIPLGPPPQTGRLSSTWLVLGFIGFECFSSLACSNARKSVASTTSSTGGASGSGGSNALLDAAATDTARSGETSTGGAGSTGAAGSPGVEAGGGGLDTDGAAATNTDGMDADAVVDSPATSEEVDGGVTLDAATIPVDAPQATGFLHVEGNRLVDSLGNSVRFTGVNWFGFETSMEAPHGIWARDYASMLKQIHDLGFNSVRLPWSNAILRSNAAANSINTVGADPYDGTNPMNGDLIGKTPLEILDLVIAAAGKFGLKMILDNHSRQPDDYLNEKLWYTAETSEAQWIADWVTLANRYAGNPTVVGFDLDNEPHGTPSDGGATWGTGNSATDWNSAAERCGNAVLAANPDVLIVVEGVQMVGPDNYWSGGNLSGVRTNPINLAHPEKLVYSAHDYGPEVYPQPWFTDATFPANLPALWTENFDFIMQQELGHILLGEFGIKDPTSYSGTEGIWFSTVLNNFGSTYSWTFWCWNPDSGDTGGILQDDWLTPQKFKMDALTPHMADPIK